MTDFQKLAATILRAQDIHEASYVKGDATVPGGWIGSYQLSQSDAGELAAKELQTGEDCAELAWWLNFHCWNDAADWARKVQAR